MTTFSGRVLFLGFLCAGAASSATAQTTRDSANIRIVENATPAWAAGQGWKLSPKPIVDIGSGVDKDHEFGRITDATRLSDGRLLVADASTLQLKFYDATGHHIKSVGGKGGGPGEFSNFVGMRKLPGDSSAVDALRTTSIFTPTGAYVRNVSFGPFPEGVMQSPFVGTLGRFDNGTTVVMDFPQGRRKPAGAQRWIDSSTLFLVNPGGAVIRPLGKTPVVTFVAGTTHPSTLDFGPQAQYASSGRSIYLGFSNQYVIGVYNTDWKLERLIRRAWTPRQFSTADHDTYVDGWMKMWSKKTGVERDAERQEMRSDSYPKTLPA